MALSDLVPYLLVVAVISLMIAPVMWMQPSPRQKRLARLRERALAVGMRPELRTVPRELLLPGEDKLMSYSMVRRERLRRPPPRRFWIRQEGQWQGTLEAPAILSLLPGESLLIEVQDNTARLYWKEGDSLEDVDKIKQVLEELLGV